MLPEDFSWVSTKKPVGGSDDSFQSGCNESDASMSEGLIRRERFMHDKNGALFQYFSKSFCLFSLRLTSQNPRITPLEESSRGLSSKLLLQARSPMGSDWVAHGFIHVGLEKSPHHLWASCSSAGYPHGGKAFPCREREPLLLRFVPHPQR